MQETGSPAERRASSRFRLRQAVEAPPFRTVQRTTTVAGDVRVCAGEHVLTRLHLLMDSGLVVNPGETSMSVARWTPH